MHQGLVQEAPPWHRINVEPLSQFPVSCHDHSSYRRLVLKQWYLTNVAGPPGCKTAHNHTFSHSSKLSVKQKNSQNSNDSPNQFCHFFCNVPSWARLQHCFNILSLKFWVCPRSIVQGHRFPLLQTPHPESRGTRAPISSINTFVGNSIWQSDLDRLEA